MVSFAFIVVALIVSPVFGRSLDAPPSPVSVEKESKPYTKSLVAPTAPHPFSPINTPEKFKNHERSSHSLHARLFHPSPFPSYHAPFGRTANNTRNATSYQQFQQDVLSNDTVNASFINGTGSRVSGFKPATTYTTSKQFASVTPQRQSSITPIPLPTSQPGSNATGNTYYPPAFSYEGNASNPVLWKARPTPKFGYTRNGGRRDMSQPHQFVNMNVIFHGNRSAVDLESTDGVQDIDCKKTQWHIRTKDQAHLDVARSWPQDVILVTGSFCGVAATRKLIEVHELSFLEPDTIVATGKMGYLNNGFPASSISVEFGHHKPTASHSRVTPKTVVSPQSTKDGYEGRVLRQHNQKRNLWGGVKSKFGSAESDVHSHVTSAISHVSTIESSIQSKVTSDVESAASAHFSTSKPMHIQVPKATPTDASPWGSAGKKLASVESIDIWDLGIQVNGIMELGGGFTADLAHIGRNGWASAYMFMNGSDWNFDIPLGLDFRGNNVHYENTNLSIGEPIDFCEEIGCVAIQDVFEIGSTLQMNLNASIDVKSSGKINMGTNFSYAAPAVSWGPASPNASGFGPSNKQKWFNVSDGSIQVTGGIGVDFVQFNGLKIQKYKEADFYVQIVDGVSLVTTVADQQKGPSKPRRDVSVREHPKDILARELSRRDTCAGVGISLALDEEIMLQADAGPFNGGKNLFATQVPLYSTCFS